MTMEVIIAVDVGSSSVKCNAYSIQQQQDANANAPPHPEQQVQQQQQQHHRHQTEVNQPLTSLAQSAKVMRAVEPTTGHVMNVEQIIAGTEECLDQVLASCEAALGHDFTVVALGFSSFTMNLIGLDEDGRPVGPAATLSYACNTREVVEEVERLKRDLTEEEQQALYQKTGTPIHGAYAMPQLRVLYERHPDLAERIYQWQPLSNLCIAKWTGHSIHGMPMSYCEASWTGLLNFMTCTLEPAALALLPSDACRKALPQTVCDVDESLASGLAVEYQAKWPQLAEAAFFLGVGDGAVANIGSKCSVPDRIACTIGTSAAARVCVPLPIQQQQQGPPEFDFHVPNGLFCYRIDKHHVLLGGALTDGGSAVEWIRNLLNLNDPKEFDACIERVGQSLQTAEQAAHDHNNHNNNKATLSTVPFLSGERSTGYRSGATGVLFGLTRDTTATDLVQSCLEGVTLRLGAIIERIERVVMTPAENPNSDAVSRPRIIVSGKGLEVNRVWRQMIANCTGLETILDKGTFGGTCRGIAVLVLSKIQEDESPTFPVEPVGGHGTLKYPPQPQSGAYWKQMVDQQERLIEAVSPLYGACT